MKVHLNFLSNWLDPILFLTRSAELVMTLKLKTGLKFYSIILKNSNKTYRSSSSK